MRSRLSRAWTILRRRGVLYPFRLLVSHVLPRLLHHAAYRWPRRRLRSVLLLGALTTGVVLMFVGHSLFGPPGWFVAPLLGVLGMLVIAGRRSFHRRGQVAQARRWLETAPTPTLGVTRWTDWTVDEETRRAVEAARTSTDGEVVLARVDNDGRALGLFGPLPGWSMVEESDFVPRRRFPIELILDPDGFVLVRKRYPGQPEAFWREVLPLVHLADEATVPNLARFDERTLTVDRHLLRGETVRDRLVASGADILSVNTQADGELQRLDAASRLEAVWRRAYSHLDRALPGGFVDRLEEAMNGLHRAGVTGFSLTYGNVVVEEDGDRGARPALLDFDHAMLHPRKRGFWRDFVFAWRRDQDREKFNRIYNRDVLTETSARRELANCGDPWYAPIDFGRGLAVGGFWTTESGTGRWEFLNRDVAAPLVAGRRVLDLGSNNGLLPMLMLRAGASEVVAVERDAGPLETARLVHRVFEWRDQARYALRFEEEDMRFLLDRDPGIFDVATAYCSLYYLDAEDMRRVVERLAELVPLVILQAKDDTRAEAANNKAEKSTAAYLADLLRGHGFPEVEIHAPPGFARPLLVGRRGES